MEFIPRRNLPEGLAQTLVQIMSRLNNPIAEGINTAGRSIGGALGDMGDRNARMAEIKKRAELDINKEFLESIKNMALEDRLGPPATPSLNLPAVSGANPNLPMSPSGLPTRTGFNTEDLYRAMGGRGAVPGGSRSIGKREPKDQLIDVDDALAKKYPGLQSGSKVRSTFPAEYELKLREGGFRNKFKEMDLEIKRASLGLKKGKEGDKALDRLVKVRHQALQELQKSSDQVDETAIKHRMTQIDAELGKALPGFNTDMEKDIRNAKKIVGLGKLSEEEANARLMKKYPQLTDVLKKKPGWFDSLFGGE